MLNLTELCYLIFAPISCISELILVYSFFKLKQFKNHPEIIIFWQCVSQIIIDLHWFTGIKYIHEALPTNACLFLGSFSAYFYLLSWDYNLILSIEILLKILNPHQESYKKRNILYHLTAHLTSFAVFIILMTSGTDGRSVLKTCFIEAHSIYEMIVFFPALFHFPLCVGIIGYTLYISQGTYFAPYLKYHMIVVGVFSFSWVPIAFLHGLGYKGFGLDTPVWSIYLAVILGAISGFSVFVARMMQRGLLKHVVFALFLSRSMEKSLMIDLTAPDIGDREEYLVSFSQLFNTMTVSVRKIKGIKDILMSVRHVLVNSNCTKNHFSLGNNSRKWTFSIGNPKKKVKIFQYNTTHFELIMSFFKVHYIDIIKSFEIQNDSDLNERVKVNGGRSGAFFYKTADQEFIIKTISREELQTFRLIIQDYTERITSKEGSMLTKVFGIFKIKIEKTNTFRIMLMENLASRLSSPIYFDLKGSKSDRRVTNETFSDIALMSRNVVYKDLDFADNIGQITVSHEELVNIVRKLKGDAKFLEKYLIMDYSLLVMVENVRSLKSSLIDKTFIACHGKFLVFAGVIDFLQIYNIQKKLEHRYKKLKNQDSVQLSSIAPGPYRKRFIKMIKTVFLREELNLN